MPLSAFLPSPFPRPFPIIFSVHTLPLLLCRDVYLGHNLAAGSGRPDRRYTRKNVISTIFCYRGKELSL
jgi:hypothetical protein